jgi:hypothetical protein
VTEQSPRSIVIGSGPGSGLRAHHLRNQVTPPHAGPGGPRGRPGSEQPPAAGERIAVDVDESEAVDLELRPGEMSLHHCNVIHGSNPNRTSDKRIGFIVRFVTGQIGRRVRPLVRVRGVPFDGELERTEQPATSDPAEGLARWMEFNRRRQRS